MTVEWPRYRGVAWHKRDRKWRVKVRYCGRDYNLGYFDGPKYAARVYDIASILLRGDDAKTNFVDSMNDKDLVWLVRTELKAKGALRE